LAHLTVTGSSVSYDIWWNYVELGSVKIYFSSSDCTNTADSNYCDKCTSGGKGLIAMSVFAFLGLTFVLFLSIIRIFGFASLSAFEPTRKSLLVEWSVTCLNTFWIFLGVCAWGGTCFRALGQLDNSSVKGTGYAYFVVIFIFMLGNIIIGWLIRSDASAHLGSSSSGSDYQSEQGGDPNTTNYNPPATYQYGQDGGNQYAAQYNADVVPAAV